MLGVAQLECSSKEESLRVLVDHTEHKWCPGLHQEGVTSSSRGVITYSALMRTHLESWVWDSVPQYHRDVDILERIL